MNTARLVAPSRSHAKGKNDVSEDSLGWPRDGDCHEFVCDYVAGPKKFTRVRAADTVTVRRSNGSSGVRGRRCAGSTSCQRQLAIRCATALQMDHQRRPTLRQRRQHDLGFGRCTARNLSGRHRSRRRAGSQLRCIFIRRRGCDCMPTADTAPDLSDRYGVMS